MAALLKNVVGIVSGGASGLGAATVARILEGGGRVVVADLPSQYESFLWLATASCADAAVTADTSVSPLVVARFSPGQRQMLRMKTKFRQLSIWRSRNSVSPLTWLSVVQALGRRERLYLDQRKAM